MKKKIINLIAIYGLIILMGAGCSKENSYTWSEYVYGYVVGTFKCQLESNRNKFTPIGYCILLENKSDSLKLFDFYTFNLSDKILNYSEVFSSPYFYNVNNCGPLLLYDSLRNKIKIRFQYRIISENEKIKFDCGPCSTMALPFNWEYYKEVWLKDVKKVEK